MPYQVKLTVFEGPLDLLLQLIERRELDITTVSLASVTDQYLEYISVLANLDPDILANFLVIAARLILIKSQALLPRPAAVVQEEEESGDDLVRQLQEYKRFKEVAALLRERDERGLHSYIRLATSGITPRVQVEGVVLNDLTDAMRRVLMTLPEEPPAPSMARAQFTIAEKIALIEAVLTGDIPLGGMHDADMMTAGPLSFQRLLSTVTSRVEAIVTFLALLELMKQQRVMVQQGEVFGEITIVLNEKSATAATEPPPPSTQTDQ